MRALQGSARTKNFFNELIIKIHMNAVLSEIIKHKKIQIEERKKSRPVRRLFDAIDNSSKKKDSFLSAVSRRERINVIAEIKKATPSLGVIRPYLDVKKIASDYKEGGAAAISVLTEEKYFHGDIYHILEAKESTELPVLRKDFIIDEYQIYESRYFDADAVLLIKSILGKSQISKMANLAQSLFLTPFVEVHSEEELKEVLEIPEINLIGINNRNLNDLKVNLGVSRKLLTEIPAEKTVVIESGIKTKSDIEEFIEARKGSSVAFLIGTTFMQCADIKSRLKEFTNDKN